MRESHPRQILHRVFRKDIGRKLIALFLAFMLFAAIDKQVADEQLQTVNIRYVDEQLLEDESLGDDFGRWVLFVADRRVGGDVVYVIPDSATRPLTVTFKLKGTKTAIEKLRATSQRFTYVPSGAGKVPLALADLRGLDEIEDVLGKSGVSIVQAVEFDVKREEVRRFDLHPQHLVKRGREAAGWRFTPSEETVSFDPQTIWLRGPSDELDRLKQSGTPFEPVSVALPGPSYRVDLELARGLREAGVRRVSQSDTSLSPGEKVSAVLTLARSMVPFDSAKQTWARYRLPVVLTFVTLDPVAQARWDAGDRLQFKRDALGSDGVLRREVQLFVAESERKRIEDYYEGKSGERVQLQRSFSLAVYAEAPPDLPGPGTIQISRSIDPHLHSRVAADLEFLEVRLIDPVTNQPTLEEQEVQIVWVPKSSDGSG